MKSVHLIAAAILLMTMSGAAAAQTAVPSSEQVFTPIAPCRVFDSSKSTPLKGGVARNVHVNGAFAYPSQGGTAGGCGIPASATAVAVSLASSGTTAGGKILTSAPGIPGTAIVMGLIAGQTQVANAIVSIGGHGFVLHPSAGSTNITADITGYYAPHIAAYIAPDGSIIGATSRIVSVTNTGVGVYTIVVDRDVSYCAVSINTAGLAYYGNGGQTGSEIHVSTWTLSSTATRVFANIFFHLIVQC